MIKFGVLLLAGISTLGASTVTLTMDEVPNQLINGLIVSKGGVDFTFTDTANALFYNAEGPESITYVSDPSIEGSVVPFQVSFSSHVTSIQFGFTELAFAPLRVSVDLLNGAAVVNTLPLDLSLVDPFAEGQFNWTGSGVDGLVLHPDTNAGAIAFDNLTVSTATTPEPATLTLMGGALLGLGMLRRRLGR